jgi:hypothetical protein
MMVMGAAPDSELLMFKPTMPSDLGGTKRSSLAAGELAIIDLCPRLKPLVLGLLLMRCARVLMARDGPVPYAQ